MFFLSPEFGTKFQRKVPLFLDIPEFPVNTGWKGGPTSKISPIPPAVSTEFRLVTDRGSCQTRRIAIFYTCSLNVCRSVPLTCKNNRQLTYSQTDRQTPGRG